MWCLKSLQRLEADKARRRAAKPSFPKYGYTVDNGIHLRCEQRLLTFFIPLGPKADAFLAAVQALPSEEARSAYIASLFPFAT
jgi:hypothetical protein